jgi:hypothetical protein
MDFAARGVQLDGMRAQLDPGEMGQLECGAKSLRLLLHVVDQFRALNAFRPAGKVLHQRGDGELAARLVAFQHQRVQASRAV